MKLSKCLQRSIIVGLACSAAGWAVSVGAAQEKAGGKENAASKQDAVAIDNAKKLVRESQQFFEKEMKPLQEAGSAKMAGIQAQLGLQMRYLEELKNVNDDSLAKVHQEMQQTADRLKMLVRLESVLTDMNPEAIQQAIATGNQEVAEMEQLRNDVFQPINQEMSLIIQANGHRNEELTSVMNPFFKDAGVNELSGLVRKHPGANFSYSHYACLYENETENIVLHVTLQFQTTLNSAGSAVERIDDKHAVYQWNDDQVIVLLKGMQLNIHDSTSKLKKQKLMTAVKQLIDLDGLSRLAE